jgi:putative membrane protein
VAAHRGTQPASALNPELPALRRAGRLTAERAEHLNRETQPGNSAGQDPGLLVRGQHVDAADVPWILAERRVDEGVNDRRGLVLAVHSRSDAGDVRVVVFTCELGGLEVVHQRSTGTTNLVRRDLLAVARATDHDAEAARVVDHTDCGGYAVRWVVIAGYILSRSAVDSLVAGRAQMSDQNGLQLEACMVTAEVDAHAGHRASSTAEHNAGVSSIAVQPVLLLVALASVAWYLRLVGRLPSGIRWPRHRVVSLGFGWLLILAATCGPLATETQRAFWVWLSQGLLLLLILPIPLMLAQPVELARLAAPRGSLTRLAESPVGRFAASPIVGAGLIPLACLAFLFGPLPGTAISNAPAGWLVQLLMLLVGLVIVLPLISTDVTTSSLAFGAAIAIGLLELLIDAVPGIVMRLSTHPVTNFFDHRLPHAGQLSALHDQQFAGGILWCVAELLDLPFMFLIFHRWIQADAREAAIADRVASASVPGGPDDGQPWFLNDPRLKDRFR